MTQTLRLTALDEMFITDDIDIVPSVQIEARVSGRFDLDRLAAALRAAVAKHALARARLGRASLTARTLYWEVPDRADHLAVEITDEPVGEVRSRFYARAPELHRSPVFAVAVVRETVGDRLLLNFHHAAFDGMGGLRLLLSLARAYAGEPDEVGGPPIEEARNLKGVAGSRDLFDVLIRARGLAKPAIDRKRTTRVAPDGGSPDGPRFVFAPLTIESDEMATAVARRPEGATVNDLAMAALALTILQWNRTHDVPAADSVSVNMPVNFRPTAWSTEVISNFASYLAIVLRVDEVTDLEKATAIVAGTGCHRCPSALQQVRETLHRRCRRRRGRGQDGNPAHPIERGHPRVPPCSSGSTGTTRVSALGLHEPQVAPHRRPRSQLRGPVDAA